MENLVKNANQNSYAQPKSWELNDANAPTGSLDITGIRTKEMKKQALKNYKDDVAFWNSSEGRHIKELNEVVSYMIFKHALTIEVDYIIEADPLLIDKDDPEAMAFVEHTAGSLGSWESVFKFWKDQLEKGTSIK